MRLEGWKGNMPERKKFFKKEKPQSGMTYEIIGLGQTPAKKALTEASEIIADSLGRRRKREREIFTHHEYQQGEPYNEVTGLSFDDAIVQVELRTAEMFYADKDVSTPAERIDEYITNTLAAISPYGVALKEIADDVFKRNVTVEAEEQGNYVGVRKAIGKIRGRRGKDIDFRMRDKDGQERDFSASFNWPNIEHREPVQWTFKQDGSSDSSSPAVRVGLCDDKITNLNVKPNLDIPTKDQPVITQIKRGKMLFNITGGEFHLGHACDVPHHHRRLIYGESDDVKQSASEYYRQDLEGNMLQLPYKLYGFKEIGTSSGKKAIQEFNYNYWVNFSRTDMEPTLVQRPELRLDMTFGDYDDVLHKFLGQISALKPSNP